MQNDMIYMNEAEEQSSRLVNEKNMWHFFGFSVK